MPLFSPSDSHLPFATFPSSSPHPSSAMTAGSSPPAFFFRRRTGKLDWTTLSSVSLHSIIATIDVSLLQQHVEALTYADITPADLSQATDAQIVHVIRLAQLTIEYLLNVQNYLLRLHKQRSKTTARITADLDRGRAMLAEKDARIDRLEQENKFLKKLNRHYASGAPPQSQRSAAAVPAAVELIGGVHQCEWCRASFVGELYLMSHIARRHPDQLLGGRGGAGKKGKRKTVRGSEDDGGDDSDDERSRGRKRKEEEERVRKELAQQREELEAERRRLKADKHKRHHRTSSTSSSSSTASPHHTSQRPAPITVTPPAPAVTKEWLDGLERRVKEETLAAVRAGESDEVRKLREKLDGIVRGDIPISPNTAGQDRDGEADEAKRRRREHELLQEIDALKRQQVQHSLSPFTPSARRGAAASAVPQAQAAALSPVGSGSSLRAPAAADYSARRFAALTEFPTLLSRFQHDEADLLASMRRFSQAVEGVREEDGAAAPDTRGYESEVRGVETEVERVMGEGWVDESLERRWGDIERKERDLDARRRAKEERARERSRQQREAEQSRHDAAAAQFQQQQQLMQLQQLHQQSQQSQQQPPLARQFSATMAASPSLSQPPVSASVWAQPQPQALPAHLAPVVSPQLPQPVVQPLAVQQFSGPQVSGIIGAASRGEDGLQLLLRRQHEQAGIVDEMKQRMQPQQQLWQQPAFKAAEEEKQPEEAKEEQPSLFPARQSLTTRDSRGGPLLSDSRAQAAKEEMSDEEEVEDDNAVSMPSLQPQQQLQQPAQPLLPATTVPAPAKDEVETISLDQPLSPAPAASVVTGTSTVPTAGGGGGGMKLQPIRTGRGLLLGGSGAGSGVLQRPTAAPAAAAPAFLKPNPAASFFNDSSAEVELEEEEF